MRRFGNKGVGGPLEDLQAWVIVVIGLVIFITVATYTYGEYYLRHDIQDPEEVCWILLKNVRGYNEIVKEGGVEGDLSYHKIWSFFDLEDRSVDDKGFYNFDDEDLLERINNDFRISEKYTIFIMIIDRSSYENYVINIAFNIATEKNENMMFKSAPITITVNHIEVHNGELLVGIGWDP